MKKERTKAKKGRSKRQFEAEVLDLPSLRLVDSQESSTGEPQPAAPRGCGQSPEMIQQIIERIKSI